MAGAYRRGSDKKKKGKYTGWYFDETGKRRMFAGTVDYQVTLQMARAKETEARQIREGLIDPADRIRRESLNRPVAEHLADWRSDLLARDNVPRYCKQIAAMVGRLLVEAKIPTLAELTGDKIQAALGRWREQGLSARTRNEALRGVKSFALWLEYADRLKEVPKSLRQIRPSNVEADRRLVRRALSAEEIERLLKSTEASEVTRDKLTGPERAILYRLALGTGFRVGELRSLTPERFHLDGPEPAILVPAAFTKNGKEALQPIATDLARRLKPWLEGRRPGELMAKVPKYGAKMLRADMEACGIPYRDQEGRVADFHALRTSYITTLIRSGANPKVVQALARHSTITLTLGIYTSVDANEKRKALEGD